MNHITDPAMFERFHNVLTSERAGYTPWYILLSKGLKDPVADISWKQLEGRLTFEQALKKMRAGHNIGIAATGMDALCIVDVDDITATPDEIVKPTLSTRSRKRIGRHYFYFTDDPRCKETLTTEGKGEIRSCFEYVVAPGSYVICDGKTMAAMPESQIEFAGRYTVENERAPDTIVFEELPPVFLAAAQEKREIEKEARERRKAKANARKDKKSTQGSDKNKSAMWDLSMDDVTSIPNKTRFSSLFHESTTGKNTALNDNGGLTCWRHLVTHTPLSALAVLAGVADCNSAGQGFRGGKSSSIDYDDGMTLFKMWAFAKREGMIPKEDPIPSAAIQYYAVDSGICKADEITDGWKLPHGAYSQTLGLIESKEGISTGRSAIKPTVTLPHAQPSRNTPETPKISLKILEGMFTIFDGKKIRKNTAFLISLSKALSDIEHPTFDDVWGYAGREYAESTKKQNRSWIKRSGWLDGDKFGVRFWNEYQKRWAICRDDKNRLIALKQEAPLRHSYDVDVGYDYDNTMDVIRANLQVTYNFPEALRGSAQRMDYSNTDTLQIVKLNHVGGNPRTAIPLTYAYSCTCGNEIELPYEAKEIFCDKEECGKRMVRSRKGDVFFAGYASQVIADDFNNLPILSLIPIPLGEFNAAVFLRRNKTGYYLFMIAVDNIVIESSDIVISEDEHAIWQLIRQIDQQHEARLKCIEGMDWYKAGILLSYLANLQRYTSMNVLAVGKGGTGKTSVPRFYLATLTQQWKLQDALSLSSPGLYGSTSQIKIGESVVTIPEAGLLSRYQMVIVDEAYLKGISILPVLRSTLRASTINKEVAGNRTSMIKNACVIGTSNPIVEVLIAQSGWMDKWINANEEGMHTTLTEEFAHAAMVEEWIKRDLDWHTGQPFPDMDRWMIIFFIEKDSNKLEKYHLNAEDMKLGDIELSKLFYDQSMHDYFLLCSQIKVDYESHSDRILEFIVEIRKHDTIHSDRIGQDVALVLTLSAQINGRANLTDDDFDFVRELWSKTCEWIDVSELSHNSEGRTYRAAEWTIERIKKGIHERMKGYEGSQKYYHTSRGFSIIAAELEEQGAPSGLIDDTIKHYRSNPNQ